MKLNRLIAASIVGISLLTTSTSAFACEHDSHSWSWFGFCNHSDKDKDNDKDNDKGHDCNHGGSSSGSSGHSTSGGGSSTGSGSSTSGGSTVGPKG
jgi:hypothetical protein